MRLPLIPTRRKGIAYALYGFSAALLAGSITLAGFSAPAAHAVTPGSDWSSNGVMADTESAVTVQWDNSGATPGDDVVSRSSAQVIPHTGGKTYADVDQSVRDTIQNDFGGMKLTVSQTTGLRQQAVNVSVTGADVGPNATSGRPNSLLIMQCWGPDGDTQPDPARCQDGAGTIDGGPFAQRKVAPADESLVEDSDLKAPTGVTVLGQTDGSGDITLVGIVHAGVFVPAGQTDVATGARGKVQFLDPDRNVVAEIGVTDGVASATLIAPAYGITDYTAQYIATPDENYTNSPVSAAAADLPYHPSTSPGAGTNTSPNRTNDIPFEAVDGTVVSSVGIGSYFTQTTTNELRALTIGDTPTDVSSRSFQLQTGAEAPGLGCGARDDAPSTSTCWLVAVPFDSSLPAAYQLGAVSPLTPSLWSQRVQVKLTFAPVTTTCGTGDREVSSGSELILGAMNSWIPGICKEGAVDLGFVQTGDRQARAQYQNGTASLIFTSSPVDDAAGGTSTLYAPVALSAVTIAVLSVDGATRSPVTGIKLNARLVAKLLTQSYQNAIDNYGSSSEAPTSLPWQSNLPQSLQTDPEFRTLNPTLPSTATLTGSDLIVTISGTDATTAVWNWIVSDPAAKAFLDGCPDPASGDSVINPFYSTRSYAECKDQAQSLEATAASWRAPQSASNPNGSVLAPGYIDSPMSYPPTSAAFPQPGYYERAEQTDSQGRVTQLPLTLADLHPRDSTFSAVASDVFRGQEKSLGFL